jgi:hypothetical protein
MRITTGNACKVEALPRPVLHRPVARPDLSQKADDPARSLLFAACSLKLVACRSGLTLP